MKYFFVLLWICLSASKSFSAFDAYSTLYKAKINLKDGNQIIGYYYHFNYDTIPYYKFTNNEFHHFLIKMSENSNDTIEIYTKLQNVTIQHIFDSDSMIFSAVVKKDLFRIHINDIKSTEFIYGQVCGESKISCEIIKELNQYEVNSIQQGKVKFLHRIIDPNMVLNPEGGFIHFVFGNNKSIGNDEIGKLINSLYTKKENYYKFEIPQYYKLKETLREKNIIIITFYQTDYFISNDLISE